MHCAICGSPLDHAGQGHTCRSDRTSPDAEIFATTSRRVVRFGVVYAALVLVAGAFTVAGYTAISTGAADPTSVGTQASVLFGGVAIGGIGLVCLLSLVVYTVVWIIGAHKLAPGGPGPIGYGGLALCVLLIGLAFVVPAVVPTVAGQVATGAAMRIAGVVLLIAAVRLVRSRIGNRTALPAARKPIQVTSEDWDASKWDPEVLRDIERRRGSDSR